MYKAGLSLFLFVWVVSVQAAFADDLTASNVRIQSEASQSFLFYQTAQDSTWAKLCPVLTLPKGRPLYHWGDTSDTERWQAQGKVFSQELDGLLTQSGGEAAGGGFYVSESPADSTSYGPGLSVVVPDHDLQIVDIPGDNYGMQPYVGPNDGLGAIRVFGSGMSTTAQGPTVLVPRQALIDLGMEGIRYTQTWIVLIRSTAVNVVHEGTLADLYRDPDFKQLGILDLTRFDQRIPLQPDPNLQQTAPSLEKLLEGETLTTPDLQAVAGVLYNPFIEGTLKPVSPLSIAIDQFFHSLVPSYSDGAKAMGLGK